MSNAENAAPDCPNAKLMAAFVSQNVDSEERRQIESHLAYYDDCRDGVAFLIKNVDDLAKRVPPS